MNYPEMVKTNARYRGPMESRKLSNSVRDIQKSISLLRQKFNKQNDDGGSVRTGIFRHYTNQLPEDHQEITQRVRTVKGGEL